MVRLSITSAIGAFFLAALSVEAFAGPEGYCHAYSRDIANRKAGTPAGNALTGTSLGIFTGEVVEGASSSTVLSTGDANTKWRRAYVNAYDDCMKRYEKVVAASAQPEVQADQPADEQSTNEAVTDEPAADWAVTAGQPVEQVEEPVAQPVKKPAKAKAKAKNKPEPGTQAWNNACDKRYRTFNPKTGMYMSRSGKMKKCRL